MWQKEDIELLQIFPGNLDMNLDLRLSGKERQEQKTTLPQEKEGKRSGEKECRNSNLGNSILKKEKNRQEEKENFPTILYLKC